MPPQQQGETYLFIRSGVLLSAPRYFLPNLSSKYQASFVEPGELRSELYSYGLRGSELTASTIEETQYSIGTMLGEGQSVVLNSYLNTFEQRQRLRDIAEKIGGISVILMDIQTDIEVVETRLMSRYAHKSELIEPKLKFIEQQYHRLRIEGPGTKGEPHVRLDGSMRPGRLLDIVRTYINMRKQGIFIM